MSYILSVYTSIFDGSEPQLLAQFTPDDAIGWERSIKLDGGYYDGSFTLNEADHGLAIIENMIQTWEHCHVVETCNGIITWEGFADDMTLYDTEPFAVEITCRGYIATLMDQYCISDGASVWASEWLATILDTYCPMVASYDIETNLFYVTRSGERSRPLDEIEKVVQAGNADGDPYRYYMTANRKFVYAKIDTDPVGYVDGGVIMRKSRSDTYNSIKVEYDNNGKIAITDAAEDAASIARYGKRELYTSAQNIPFSAAEPYRDTLLSESGWSYLRAVGTQNVDVYLGAGEYVSHEPQFVQPGIFQNRKAFLWSAKFPQSAWLRDKSHFVVDEVRVDANNQLSLRTEYYDDSDLLELRGKFQLATAAYWDKYRGQMKYEYNADGKPDFGDMRKGTSPKWDWKTGRWDT